jgi:hypothetical protein
MTMNTGVIVSWLIYGVAAAAFAFFALRHFHNQHEQRMTVIDSAIEAEQTRFRELQSKWAAEDEEYRRAEKAREAAEEEVAVA